MDNYYTFSMFQFVLFIHCMMTVYTHTVVLVLECNNGIILFSFTVPPT